MSIDQRKSLEKNPEQSYQPPPGDPYTGNAAYQGPYAQQGYGQPAYPQTEYGQQQSHCQQPIYGQPPMSNAYGSPQQGGYYPAPPAQAFQGQAPPPPGYYGQNPYGQPYSTARGYSNGEDQACCACLATMCACCLAEELCLGIF